jgi:ParB family chromosome partitioning protein
MTENIPLNKLLAWEGNVRKTNPDKGISELAASIEAHGLLQSLVVRKDKRGKYAVVAGRRRLSALKSLADSGKIYMDDGIPCTVIADGADATEISLAENVQREPMHPADEFDAFKALIDGGTPPADVAARFGVTETVVQKRLKLARVSPKLLKAYRKGEMSLQHIMAFTVTDDHAEQERVWNELSDWQKRDPDNIRGMLTEREITASDRRVKFVTLKTYEKAGGAIRRDLFSEGDDEGVFIDDVVLLESLVAKKLEKTADKLRKEGWKWVEVRSAFDHDEWSKCERRYPEDVPFSAEEETEFEQLNTEYETLCEIEEPDDEQQSRLDAITERLDALQDRPTFWTPETLAIAGAVVTLDRNGEADIHAGLVKPEDAPAKAAKRKSEAGGGGSVFAASLIESLTAQRSAALNAVLMGCPSVALAATVHAIAAQVFYHQSREDRVLQITASAASLHRVEGSQASASIEAAHVTWAGCIPNGAAELFVWCLAQPQERLLELLAFCAGQTVNATILKHERDASARTQQAALLADALKLDMAAWFTPTASNYFGKVSKAQIIEALREVKGAAAPAWSEMKKADLAALAEREIAGSSWLPEPLRAHAPAQEA